MAFLPYDQQQKVGVDNGGGENLPTYLQQQQGGKPTITPPAASDNTPTPQITPPAAAQPLPSQGTSEQARTGQATASPVPSAAEQVQAVQQAITPSQQPAPKLDANTQPVQTQPQPVLPQQAFTPPSPAPQQQAPNTTADNGGQVTPPAPAGPAAIPTATGAANATGGTAMPWWYIPPTPDATVNYGTGDQNGANFNSDADENAYWAAQNVKLAPSALGVAATGVGSNGVNTYDPAAVAAAQAKLASGPVSPEVQAQLDALKTGAGFSDVAARSAANQTKDDAQAKADAEMFAHSDPNMIQPGNEEYASQHGGFNPASNPNGSTLPQSAITPPGSGFLEPTTLQGGVPGGQTDNGQPTLPIFNVPNTGSDTGGGTPTNSPTLTQGAGAGTGETSQPSSGAPIQLKDLGSYLEKLLGNPSTYDSDAMQKLLATEKTSLDTQASTDNANVDADTAARGLFFGSNNVVDKAKFAQGRLNTMANYEAQLADQRSKMYGQDRQNTINNAFKFGDEAQQEQVIQSQMAQLANNMSDSDFNSLIQLIGQMGSGAPEGSGVGADFWNAIGSWFQQHYPSSTTPTVTGKTTDCANSNDPTCGGQ